MTLCRIANRFCKLIYCIHTGSYLSYLADSVELASVRSMQSDFVRLAVISTCFHVSELKSVNVCFGPAAWNVLPVEIQTAFALETYSDVAQEPE
jgi:hypothetical protein